MYNPDINNMVDLNHQCLDSPFSGSRGPAP